MSKFLTSIGVKFYIGYSSDYNLMPSPTEYRIIPHVIENSDFDLSPEAVRTRSYDNLRYTSYAEDIIDTGGIQTLTVISTLEQDAENIWNDMADKCEEGYYIWLVVVIPRAEKTTYIPICPIHTGSSNIKLNDKITTKLNYTIVGDFLFDDAINSQWANDTWYHLPFFNNGNKFTSKDQIDVDVINMLFKNMFYLKGN